MNPSSTLYLYADVPLNNTYNDSVFIPDDLGDISNMISPRIIINYTNYSFIREHTIRIATGEGVTYNDISICNYIKFNNAITPDITTFAFITAVKYINEGCVEIDYEVDVLQTFVFANKDKTGFDMQQAYIIRQHAETDDIGDNILPEPVQLGDYVYDNYSDYVPLDKLATIVAYIPDDNISGNIVDGVFNATSLKAFNNTTAGVAALNTFIQQITASRTDAILSIYTVPFYAVNGGDDFEDGYNMPYAASGKSLVQVFERPEDVTPYTPKNNKLLTYPYCYFHIDNGVGQSLKLKYEFFDANTDLEKNAPYIRFKTIASQPVRCMAAPVGYKGAGRYTELTGYKEVLTETITLDNYPVCSYNVDTFNQWVLSSAVPSVLTLGAAATAAAFIPGAGAVSVAGALSAASGLANDAYNQSLAPTQTQGNIQAGNILCSHGSQTFHTAHAHLPVEMLKSIDNYFSIFGYAQNKIAKPNLHARLNYTYIECDKLVTTGKIPNYALVKIKEIFKNGCTFWANINTVGNYSVTNSILGGE